MAKRFHSNGRLILFLMVLCRMAIVDCSAQFVPPLDAPLILSGTFGEIRPDHFHTGIDLSTGKETGKRVYAVADGYVSRIKISPEGFGKVLYVTHKNGYVSVYAHLQSFDEKIDKLVSKEQFKQKRWDVEVFPKKGKLKVKQGDLIAASGNSGNSGGPHLHFEIRDEKTEEPLNPLKFGFNIKDSQAPVIAAVRIVPYPMQGVVLNADTPRTFKVVQTNMGSELSTKSIIQAFGLLAFEVKASDSQENSEATLGIYSIALKMDNKPVFSYKYDRLNFSDSRYANARIDYAAYYDDEEQYERCFRLPNDKLKMYQLSDTSFSTNGYINFEEDGAHDIEIVVTDYFGNKNTLRFQLLIYSSQLTNAYYNPAPENDYSLPPGKGFAVRKDNLEVTIPANATYDAYFFRDRVVKSAMRVPLYSSVYEIGDPNVPLHLPIEIGLQMKVPDSLQNKAVIVSVDKKQNVQYEGGYWKKNFVYTKSMHFGTFAVTIDTTAPVLSVQTFSGDTLRIECTDNLSGISRYEAKVDGQWVPMEYDKKNDAFLLIISRLHRKPSYNLEITVSDERGNITVLRKILFRN